MKKVSLLLCLTLLFSTITPIFSFAESMDGEIVEESLNTDEESINPVNSKELHEENSSSQTDIKETGENNPEDKDSSGTDGNINTIDDEVVPNEEPMRSTSKTTSSEPTIQNKTERILTNSKEVIQEKSINRLGQITDVNVKIYTNLADNIHITSGKDYTNTVFYIKKQANYDGAIYYLISTLPSGTEGTIGWVKSTDMISHPHEEIDNQTKTFFIKGTGSAYSKAWGGAKELIYPNLASYTGEKITVNKTDKVGNNTWYQGELSGKTIWIHSNFVVPLQESDASRLGQIINNNTKIYTNLAKNVYTFSGDKYTNSVYYIKKQVSYNNSIYYLISTSPSSTEGVIGWVKSTDLVSHPHEQVDTQSKTFVIKGTGSAYSKPWGGSRELVYSNLSSFSGEKITVTKTDKIGNNIWYQGVLSGKTVWIHSNFLESLQESNTSRLGQITNKNTKIYTNLVGNTYKTAGETYINTVYYIKKQANYNGSLYYLVSTSPSNTTGVIGWVKSTEMVSHPHEEVSNQTKTSFIKGTGSAYSKPWGGSKDAVFTSLSSHKGKEFTVRKTEKVGSNLWYQGVLEGKTVWVHSSYVSDTNESVISRLGQISNKDVRIFTDIVNNKYFTAGDKYINAVYYMKKQAEYNGQTYYLISTQPSSENGVIGWVRSADLVSHPHVGLDSLSKKFYIKGTGSAYSKTWGGSKDLVYSSLATYKGNEFNVNKTEKVGNNLWYRGVLAGKTVWVHSSYVTDKYETEVSRLAQITNNNTRIYTNLVESEYITAGETYSKTVYYIKKQANFNGSLYYMISTSPSSTTGAIGWVKSTDMVSHPHEEVNTQTKTVFIKGTGSAYSKVWGGTKDITFTSLSSHIGKEFTVRKTEKVGSNLWYQGVLEGKTVWVHSSYVSDTKESVISRLGQISNKNVRIFTDIVNNKYFTAGDKYINAVYYMKKQAEYNGQTYYLISTQPSSETGVIGWVRSADLVSHPHVGLDSLSKKFYVKGTGSAYSKTWGGSKDLVYSSLAAYKGNEFNVNKTEKVGTNLWYRGVLAGKTVWIHEAYLNERPLKEVISTYSNYDLSLNRMSEIQMAVSPMTDKSYKLWIREDAFKKGSISNGKGTIEGNGWNLRRGPGTSYLSGGTVNNGVVLTLYSSFKANDGFTWYHVRNTTGWVTPDVADLNYYLNASNFTGNLKNSLQFLKLSSSANVDIAEVNTKVLKDKGVLSGKAKSFVDAGKQYGVNEIYLISHALLETGNGKSVLATGVEVGVDNNGKTTLVTASNRSSLKNIKMTYNMYGIGARDACPLECGAAYAYDSGWFTPESAIIGGAAFIGNGYVNNGQDTLYKMRWNPDFAAKYNYASHQYATDIGWAFKQTSKMYEIYEMLETYTIILDIPRYK
ncbi:GW dipeptide domain-containing protein [Cytobacillus horneckiae]|uniref:GW dipeptide domain-containing protein n=1 Tax=Cytobacillus horneckiae TaxID=549687 RepID=UPI0020418E2A|nr:GW dipeptide domain-containing protein [Cytobacillus horneckiae]MCM3179014.1 GW dipeptide domain-containing protein [Cytobacillus horneckiae]